MSEVTEDVISNLDPMLYWCGRFLPLADSMGILRSRALLRAFMPMAKFLPPVPATTVPEKRLTAGIAEGEREGLEWWRHSSPHRRISLPYTKQVDKTVYYILYADGRYAGEFRYRHIRDLHLNVRDLLLVIKNAPEFPPRFPFRKPSPEEQEHRRVALETYLIFVMSDPDICASDHFVHFIRNHRRWAGELPSITSPLLVK